MEESYPNRKRNNVGKGEIAHYEQFLLFPQCFQKACFPEASKGVIVWEWVNVSESLVFPKNSDRNGTEKFPKAKVDYIFLFPSTGSVNCLPYYLPQDTY